MKLFILTIISITFSVLAEKPNFKAEDIKFFETKIRPLLEDKCYRCHSHEVPTKKKLKGNLFLDSRIDIIQGGNGGPAALPGKAKESAIIKYVTHEDIDERMPPKEKEWLTQEEINHLTVWIDKGMAWPDEPRPKGAEGFRDLFDIQRRKDQHWAWKHLTKYEIPKVSKQKHTVDKYVEAKLIKEGMKLNPTSSKEQLIRRAYLDLVGLLPSPEEVHSFVSDKSDDSFSKVLDKLLAQKGFGERWARHWLDLARYAESYGHEFDYTIPHAYKYRNMVIRAFNDDVPHDQWLKDHVAGDLLENPRIDPVSGVNESITATGFWNLFEASHAPVDVKEDEVLRLNNQIDTFSKSFLALTVACARCHDHKFDAITAKDFYALSGYLQSSRRQEALLDPKGKITEIANQISKIKDQIESLSRDNQDFKNYLYHAAKIFSHSPTEHTLGSSKVFADFENGYGKWTTEGKAFGDKPLSDKYRTRHHVTNFSKKHYACSYHPQNSKGQNPDNSTGKLISPKFTIKHKQISFLVAGGSYKKQTCVNLIIDNKVVKTQTGFNNRDLREVSWDVSEFYNKEARIEIIDQRKGGWGHITADRFIFSDSVILHTKEKIDAVVQKNGLRKDILISWLNELKSAYNNPSSPLHILAKSTSTPLENLKSEQEAYKAIYSQFEASTKLFEDFSEDHYKNVKLTGQAFPENKSPGFIDSGHFGNKFQGVVRSRDFIIESPHIFLKISGKDSLSRVIIEDYFLDTQNALLFRGLAKKINTSTSSPSWYRIDGDLRNYIGRRAHLEFIDHGNGSFKIEEIRFGNSDIPKRDFNQFNYHLAQSTSPSEILKNTVSSAEFQRWYKNTYHLHENEKIRELTKEINTLRKKVPTPEKVLAITDGFPLDNYVYDRGSHAKKGVDAPRAFLEALSGPTQTQSTNGSGRLELAEKILKDGRHFLARVQVNRIWLHLFGKGIVPTPDDFGVLGMKPTHPELLDYLAIKFIDFNWSNKKMIKYLMSSKTYQQSSAITNPAFETKDPTNKLYHRAEVRRLEGEIIRDIILQTSGRLDRKMYGPSIPTHLTSFMTGRGRPKSGPLDGNGRRSIYQAVRRNFLNPFFLTFDFPIPAQSIGKRNSTNVPAQALSLLNDPFIEQQAHLITSQIEALIHKKSSSEQIIHTMFQRFYSRKATAKEVQILSTLFKDKESIKQFVHILINKKEFSHVF